MLGGAAALSPPPRPRAGAPRVTRRAFLAGCAALGAGGCSASATSTTTDAGAATDAGEPPLDAYVTEQLALAKLPGLSAAIVKDGKLALLRHYGKADLEAGRAPADDTAFFLASLSKTTTGIGAMRLVEAGKLALDEDVNTYLPFRVRNPRFPDQKITTRHLMTHTSGVHETGVRLLSLAKPGDPTTSLQELLEPYLVPGGATYVEGESYSPELAPGQRFFYSNFGAALVGLVIERVSGKTFAAYMRDEVFAKLGLVNTSFLLRDLDPAKIAVPYTYVTGKGQVAEPQTSVPYLPATALRTPAKELAKLLLAVARGGELDGARLLSAETVREMTRVQVPAAEVGNDIDGQGLLWEHRVVAGVRCYGHGGSYYGTSTRMHVRPDGLGVITLANGDVHLRLSATRPEELAAYQAIEARLFAEGARL